MAIKHQHLRDRHTMDFVQGMLQVRAKVRTRCGVSEHFIEAGTLGYVWSTNKEDGTWVVIWDIPRRIPSDWRASSHPKDELQPTGLRA